MSNVLPMPDRRGLAAQIAENVRVECGRLNVSRSDLARLLGVTPSAVAKKWMGPRMWQLDELDAIRNALEIPMDRLLLARRDLYGDEVWPDQGPYPGHKYKLPRLDSNQEPTDSPDAVVIDLFSGERVA